MVRAILEGRKTQTRRIIKNPEFFGCLTGDCPHWDSGLCEDVMELECPYGRLGDGLWVREEHYRFGHWRPVPGVKTKTGRQKWAFIPDTTEVLYETPETFRKGRHHKDPETSAWHKRLARFMPRSLCRIRLKITGIRAEKLQDIGEYDSQAEGVKVVAPDSFNARDEFRDLWEKINGKASWAENPWVWVVTFEKMRP